MILKNVLRFTLIGLMLAATSPAIAVDLQSTDATGLRSVNSGGSVILLTFMAVKGQLEDRTILHYDISSLAGTEAVTLVVPISNMDPGLPGGIFEVHAFSGDGTVSIDEWDSGSLIHTFTDLPGGTQTLELDVSAEVAAASNYISFNLRAGTGLDRYWLGSIMSLDNPVLSVETTTSISSARVIQTNWSTIKATFR